MGSAHRRHHDEPVVEITSAPTNPSDEIWHRQKRYLISMGIRTACFVGAVVSIGTGVIWLGVVLIIASFLLPAIAVVMANSASPRIEGSPTDPGLYYRELGPGAGSGEEDSSR